MRTTDLAVVKAATDPWAHELIGFNPEEWLAHPTNIALTNEYGDVALFERQYLKSNMVCGHYFFHSRGPRAAKAAIELLKEAFTGPYNIDIITGLTPLDKTGALRMNEFLGFQSHGQLDTVIGPCEFVMLTKQEWENSQ